MPVGRGLVAPPATLRPVRSCRVLRLFSRPARLASRQGVRAPGRPKLRARRRLVLGLRDRGVLRRPLARGAKASPAGSTNARTRRSRPSRLAGAPQLSKRSEGTRGEASLTQSRGLPSGVLLGRCLARRCRFWTGSTPAQNRRLRGQPQDDLYIAAAPSPVRLSLVMMVNPVWIFFSTGLPLSAASAWATPSEPMVDGC